MAGWNCLDLSPCGLLGQWFVFGRLTVHIRYLDLRAVFLKSGFQDVFGQALMHSGSTRCALIPASVWLPSVMVFCPAVGTLLHQVPLEVFGVFALMFGSFLVDVMLWVFIDLGQPLDRVAVDLFVVGVQDVLPFVLLRILELLGPLPCSQGRVTLAFPEQGLIAWCIWCSGLPRNVQH